MILVIKVSPVSSSIHSEMQGYEVFRENVREKVLVLSCKTVQRTGAK